MKKNIAKGKMTEQEREDVKRRVKTVTSLGDFTNVDFVVEVRALFASSVAVHVSSPSPPERRR